MVGHLTTPTLQITRRLEHREKREARLSRISLTQFNLRFTSSTSWIDSQSHLMESVAFVLVDSLCRSCWKYWDTSREIFDWNIGLPSSSWIKWYLSGNIPLTSSSEVITFRVITSPPVLNRYTSHHWKTSSKRWITSITMKTQWWSTTIKDTAWSVDSHQTSWWWWLTSSQDSIVESMALNLVKLMRSSLNSTQVWVRARCYERKEQSCEVISP